MKIQALSMLAIAGAVCFGLGASAAAPGVSYEGKWKWNREASKFTEDPDDPTPKSMSMIITKDDGAHISTTMNVVAADGAAVSHSVAAAYDGKDYPVSGSKYKTMVKYTRIADGALAIDSHGTWGSSKETCTLSSDKKTMTCSGSETNAKGKTASSTDVWNRE